MTESFPQAEPKVEGGAEMESLSKEIEELKTRMAQLESGRHPLIDTLDISVISTELMGQKIPFYQNISTDGYEQQRLLCPHLGELRHYDDAGAGGSQLWRTVAGDFEVTIGGYNGIIDDVRRIG